MVLFKVGRIPRRKEEVQPVLLCWWLTSACIKHQGCMAWDMSLAFVLAVRGLSALPSHCQEQEQC